MNPHSLRHCWVSHVLAAGIPLAEVSKLAGHANVAITAEVYAHAVDPTAAGAAAAVMGAAIGT